MDRPRHVLILLLMASASGAWSETEDISAEIAQHVVAVNYRGEGLMPQVRRVSDRDGRIRGYKVDLPRLGDKDKVRQAQAEVLVKAKTGETAKTGDASPRDLDMVLKREDWEIRQEALDTYLQQMFANVQHSRKKKICIYIHGGMNKIAGAVEKAAWAHQEMMRYGHYPIFVCWDSSPVTTYFDQILWVREGRHRRGTSGAVWSLATSPLYLLADFGRAVTRAPVVWTQLLHNDARTLNPHHYALHRIATERQQTAQKRKATGQPEAEIRGFRPPPHEEYTDDEVAGMWARYIATLPVKAATAPLIDALGKTAWENMQMRTQSLFHQPSDFEIGVSPEDLAAHPNTGALGRFFKHLEDFATTHDAIEVTVIGHSMGAIVINEALRCIDKLELANIVYMAAACSAMDFHDAVVPYLRAHRNTEFYSLSLHPQSEFTESNFSDLPPRGSLLVWIDNFLSSPRSFLDRTVGQHETALLTLHLAPPQVRDRMHFKVFGVGKNGERPLKHQHFSGFDGKPDENPRDFWDPAYWDPKASTRPPEAAVKITRKTAAPERQNSKRQ